MNRYLKDRAMRRHDRASHGHGRGGSYNISGTYDRRNPYGSAGGYVRDYEHHGNYDYTSDYNYDYPMYYSSDYRSRDYRSTDYRYDRKAERDEEESYYQELDRWIGKLKRKNKFNINESQLIDMAKRYNISMKDYDEKEFYATFLMMVSDYGKASQDPQVYVEMAKAFLEDDDTELKGSEKLCKYLYAIVLDDE